MNRIYNMVWSLCILSWILLCSRFQASGFVTDRECYDNCNCCKNNKCHSDYGWTNVCIDGCIDHHRGVRCYELCTYNCTTCNNNRDICTECFEGFYPGSNKDCTSKCPTNCKACTSNIMCTACKNGYYNKDGSTTCPYALCPANCVCSGIHCTTCKIGFYDIGNECSKKCPPNCMSCLSRENSGHCRDCMKNHYGPLCSKICSKNCNASQNSDSSYCASSDGACIYGCKIGFFGRTCNETCSCYCIDNVCKQDSGVCVKGCTGSYEDPACAFSFGKSDDDSTATPTNIVLATLLALTTTALCILILWIIVRKTRSTDRQTGDSLCQIPEHSLAMNQTSQNRSVVGLSEADNTAYEVLDRTEGGTVNSGITEYLNLQIQKP
ncbi:multiple epidermal growth factor-like domains protein 10 isoform X2 [Mercenaria mercenaria]|uniref:multiple epidermal growth factor-like domains protein 10 isoform X2 n=1 Tax=Mercenaria mercenaria TaxID=6596 RepID=UPI00234E56CB|nr:multiple epidermal growth factor-like domains protein 10 isoform X2 [Mercenaria mercenaria]